MRKYLISCGFFGLVIGACMAAMATVNTMNEAAVAAVNASYVRPVSNAPREDYSGSQADMATLIRAASDVGALAFCADNGIYPQGLVTAKIAFSRLGAIFVKHASAATMMGELARFTYRLIGVSRQTGVYLVPVEQGDGTYQAVEKQITEAGQCQAIETDLRSLMAPGAILDVPSLEGQEATRN